MKPILVCCAHNDDQILGAGGTIAKYAKEGRSIVNIIFSYGESSHPWMQEKVTRRVRFREAQKADKLLGITKTFYLGIEEGRFHESKESAAKLKRIMSIIRPGMILTHSPADPHPDHKAVHRAVLHAADELQLKADIYCFDVWNIFDLKRPSPRMVQDISDTFAIKAKAFKLHKSQKLTMLTMIPAMYVRALLSGIRYGYEYAEVFDKVK